MKTNVFNVLMFSVFLLYGTSATAQDKQAPIKYEKWELGLNIGASQSQNDLNNFGKYENNLAGNLLLRYHLNTNLALRGNLLFGKISGDDANYSSRAGRGFTFSSPLTEASLVFEHDIFGHLRYRSMQEGRFRKILSPYAFAGMGATFTSPKNNYNEANQSDQKLAQIAEDRANNTQKVFTPGIIGMGFKVDLSERLLLQIETGLRLTWNDKLDAVSASGNTKKNDTYSFTGVGISYRFQAVKDRDHDGVTDENDACPDLAGPAATMGCPDADADGTADKSDRCPELAGLAALMGCPDADGDGIADLDDACPNQKGGKATNGCPDADGDGIQDDKDQCPEAKGLAVNNGCPDSDGDGILDKDDTCPTVKGIKAFKGCPDTDADGIEDALDQCPTVPGVAINFGCPEVKKQDVKLEDKKILEAAKYGVQFESGKSILKASSNSILDQVAALMSRYPEYKLTMKGYTDSAGADASNQKLSEARAKACFEYLVKKGIAADRMSHAGFGEREPVASNGTADGRAKNRRVEFDLIPK